MLGAGIRPAVIPGSAQVCTEVTKITELRFPTQDDVQKVSLIMKPVRKAVFPVAGFGTRFLPATKAMPKELLPIVDKPLIQYAAEEASAAGIDTLIFVTGRNKRAIEDHFDSNQELEAALRAKGKTDQADMIRNILPQGVECIFVRQPEQLGLGHAVLCAERAVGNDPFAVLLADDFLTYDGAGVTAELVKGYVTSGRTQLSVMEVTGPDISKYGVVQPGTAAGSVAGLVENPLLEAVRIAAQRRGFASISAEPWRGSHTQRTLSTH
jgi:UTP--glucose-1-phosphate uridylyltransferase